MRRRAKLALVFMALCLGAFPERIEAQVCSTPPCFIRGDANTDGRVDLADVFSILDWLLLGGEALACVDAADLNEDGGHDLTDAVRLLGFLFLGSAKPPAPYPECGDATDPGCVYSSDLCSGASAETTEPGYRLRFVVPSAIEGEPGATLIVPAYVELETSSAGSAIDGFSLSLRSMDPSRLRIKRLLAADTVLNNLTGLITTGADNEGAIVAALRPNHFPDPLGVSAAPYVILALELEATIPPAGCAPARLEFRGGLRAALFADNAAIENFLISGQARLKPTQRGAEVLVCTAVEELRTGTGAVSLDLAPQGDKLFRLSAETGRVVVVTATSTDGRSQNALFLGWGRIPTPTSFDLTLEGGPETAASLVVPAMRSEPAYLLVQNVFANENPVRLSVEACSEELFLERLAGAPAKRGASGRVSVAALGGGFDEGTLFSLEKPGAPAQAAESAVVVSQSRAELHFDLSGLAAGLYTLVARKGDVVAKLVSGISVHERQWGPLVEAQIVVSPYFRTGRARRLTITYRNAGDEEIDAPYFSLQAPAGTRLRLASEATLPFRDGTLFFLGVHPGGIAGKLPPGASGEVAVLLVSDRTEGEITLELSALDGARDPSWAEFHSRHGALATRLARRGGNAASAREAHSWLARETAGLGSSFLLGTLVHGSGDPLADEWIFARQGAGRVQGCTRTDRDGNFALGPLAAADYVLSLGGHALAATSVTLVTGQETLGLRLVAGAESRGTDICESAAPAPTLEEPPEPPPQFLEAKSSITLRHVSAIDPNEKDGPGDGLVQRGQTVAYEIHFENLATAAAAARTIVVTDTLSPNLDLSTVVFDQTQIGTDPSNAVSLDEEGGADLFSARSRSVNRDRTALSLDHDVLVSGLGDTTVKLTARIEAVVDPSTRTLRWSLSTVDPLTGEEPEEPLVGLLPPNNLSGRGHGAVSFRVNVSAEAKPGSTIENFATIYFDDPTKTLATPPVRNQVEGAPRIPFLRGDVNDDGETDISDAIALFGYLFFGQRIPCVDAADANDSGTDSPDISDPIYILAWRFLGEAPPPPPGPERCGLDGLDGGDTIDCLEYQSCPP